MCNLFGEIKIIYLFYVGRSGDELCTPVQILGPVSMLLMLVFFFIGIVCIGVTIIVRAVIITRTKGCGLWVLAFIYGTLYHVAVTPMRWADDVARKIAQEVEQRMMEESERTAGEIYPINKNFKWLGMRLSHSGKY